MRSPRPSARARGAGSGAACRGRSAAARAGRGARRSRSRRPVRWQLLTVSASRAEPRRPDERTGSGERWIVQTEASDELRERRRAVLPLSRSMGPTPLRGTRSESLVPERCEPPLPRRRRSARRLSATIANSRPQQASAGERRCERGSHVLAGPARTAARRRLGHLGRQLGPRVGRPNRRRGSKSMSSASSVMFQAGARPGRAVEASYRPPRERGRKGCRPTGRALPPPPGAVKPVACGSGSRPRGRALRVTAPCGCGLGLGKVRRGQTGGGASARSRRTVTRGERGQTTLGSMRRLFVDSEPRPAAIHNGVREPAETRRLSRLL